MTEAEAADAISVLNVSATITLPNDDSFTVTAVDAGVSIDSDTIISTAIAHGREGSIFNRVLSYITAYSTPVDIMDELKTDIDRDAVIAIVTPHVDAYNEEVNGTLYEVKGDKLVILKGAGQMGTDVDTITNLVIDTLNQSFDTCEPMGAVFTLGELKPASIHEIYDRVHVDAANAAYDPETKGIFPSVTGVSFDIPAAQAAYDAAEMGDEVVIDLIFTEPEIMAETADELLYRDVLHSVATYLTSSYNRTNNIRLAAAAINGFILEPGETFPFNDTVG